MQLKHILQPELDNAGIAGAAENFPGVRLGQTAVAKIRDGGVRVCQIEVVKCVEEIAAKLGKASPDAARMAVTRAVKRLGEAIGLTARVTATGASGAADRGASDRARRGNRPAL